jgi:hypothetical protein
MRKRDKFILFFAFVFIISLAVYCFHMTKRINTNEILITHLKADIDKSISQFNDIYLSIKMLNEDFKSQNKLNNELLYLTYKKNISDLLDESINVIIRDKPLHGGKWFVNKVDFISPSFVIVQYEDGHELYAALIQILKTDKGYTFKEVN